MRGSRVMDGWMEGWIAGEKRMNKKIIMWDGGGVR